MLFHRLTKYFGYLTRSFDSVGALVGCRVGPSIEAVLVRPVGRFSWFLVRLTVLVSVYPWSPPFISFVCITSSSVTTSSSRVIDFL